MSSNTYIATQSLDARTSSTAENAVGKVSLWEEFVLLTKFKLSMLVVYSAIAGMVIVSAGQAAWSSYILLGLGGFLITAAANMFNQVLERDYDGLMTRTMNRPLPQGRIPLNTVVLMAGMLTFVGSAFLSYLNPLTGFFGMLSLVLYAFVYTPAKRYTPGAVWIGALPGALPILIGAVAVTGTVTPIALGLFIIQFFWQIPHFWSIAYLGDEDYSRAGFKLLPGEKGKDDKSIALKTLVTAVVLLAISGVAASMFLSNNWVAWMILAIPNVHYVWKSYRFWALPNQDTARQLMFSSFLYLPLMTLAFFVNV